MIKRYSLSKEVIKLKLNDYYNNYFFILQFKIICSYNFLKVLVYKANVKNIRMYYLLIGSWLIVSLLNF